MPSVFGAPDVTFTRKAPATEDLPGITTVSVAQLSGKAEDAGTIAGHLGTLLSESGRFTVVERTQLEALAQEKGCSAADHSCVASVLPASAIVVGAVTQASYNENVETESYECDKDGKKATCVSKVRKGTVRVGANLRLVDTATGKVLYQRQLNEVHTGETTGYDGNMPEAIDKDALLEQGRQLVARTFYEAISPHDKEEVVAMEHDGDIPELERGYTLLESQDYTTAVATFKQGVDSAEANAELDGEDKGKAYYCYGVALAITGEYDEALKNLRKATALDADDDDWAEMATRVSTWKGEAAAVERQLAFAAPAPPPAVDDSVASTPPGAGSPDAQAPTPVETSEPATGGTSTGTATSP